MKLRRIKKVTQKKMRYRVFMSRPFCEEVIFPTVVLGPEC